MGMGLYEAAFATLTAIYGRNARNAITGITLLAGFASTVCWPLSAVMEAEWGWRIACFVWAGAHLLIGLPINRFMVPQATGEYTAPASPSSQPAAGGASGPIFDRPMLLLAQIGRASWRERGCQEVEFSVG